MDLILCFLVCIVQFPTVRRLPTQQRPVILQDCNTVHSGAQEWQCGQVWTIRSFGMATAASMNWCWQDPRFNMSRLRTSPLDISCHQTILYLVSNY